MGTRFFEGLHGFIFYPAGLKNHLVANIKKLPTEDTITRKVPFIQQVTT